MMWWNGEPLPTPSPGISFEERIVEGTNSGQTLGGSYSKKIIARKEDVRVTWEGLTAEESAAIGKIDASTFSNSRIERAVSPSITLFLIPSV